MSKTQEGYKGHRVNSLASKAHKLVDENPKAERKDLVAKLKKIGVGEGTAAHWVAVFRNWDTKKESKVKAKKATPASAPAAKKAAAAPKKNAKPSIKKTAATPTPPATTVAEAATGAAA